MRVLKAYKCGGFSYAKLFHLVLKTSREVHNSSKSYRESIEWTFLLLVYECREKRLNEVIQILVRIPAKLTRFGQHFFLPQSTTKKKLK